MVHLCSLDLSCFFFVFCFFFLSSLREFSLTFSGPLSVTFSFSFLSKLKLAFTLFASLSFFFYGVIFLLQIINLSEIIFQMRLSGFHYHSTIKIIDVIIANLLRLISCCAPQMVLAWLLNLSHKHMLVLAHLFFG